MTLSPATIQGAIDDATHGDVVVISPGRYYERLVIDSKAVSLRSVDPLDWAVAEATVIDATGRRFANALEMWGEMPAKALISGLTWVNADSAAIYKEGNGRQNYLISRNNIFQCSRGILHASGEIIANVIAFNKEEGISGCRGPIKNNLIFSNNGIGIRSSWGPIINNTIVGNRGLQNGGYSLGNFGTPPVFVNNIVHGNFPLENNQIQDGMRPEYCVLSKWDGNGFGNILLDPVFEDEATFDFRLRTHSPCIDSGSGISKLRFDVMGNLRPYDSGLSGRGTGSSMDIGAIEFQGQVTAIMPPSKPTNLNPPDGIRDILPNPNFEFTDFIGSGNGNTFAGAHLQVSESSNFSELVFEEFSPYSPFTQFQIPDKVLHLGRTYWWRVRHHDVSLVWTDWSTPTSFTIVDGEGLCVPRDFRTLKEAIESATHGESITISLGQYAEDIILKGKDVHLRSIDPSSKSVVGGTIVNGDISFWGQETRHCLIEGLTLGSFLSNIQGKGTAAIFHSNTMRFREVEDFDGEFNANEMTVEMFSDCNVTMVNNRITGSYRFPHVFTKCSGLFGNNILMARTQVSRNSAESTFNRCHFEIFNCTIHISDLQDRHSIPLFKDSGGTLRNSIIWSAKTLNVDLLEGGPIPSFCVVRDWSGGSLSNQGFDPGFVGAENSDFHLRPNSPCIDSGMNIAGLNTDIEGNVRPYVSREPIGGDGSGFDIGPYEYTGPPTRNGLPPAPTNLFPSDGSIGLTRFVRLEIQDPFSNPEPWDYWWASDFEIALNPDMANLIHTHRLQESTPESYRVPATLLEHDTTYYWRARIVDSAGGLGAWSSVRSFSIRSSDEPIVIGPEDLDRIQDEIISAIDGTEIILQPGLYPINLSLTGNCIILRSIDPQDPVIVSNTIIDGGSVEACLTFSGTETPDCVISGLTLQNGRPAIWGNDTFATLRKNRVTHNLGGVYRFNGLIEKNAVIYNRAGRDFNPRAAWGGGLVDCDGRIQNNVIAFNTNKTFGYLICNGCTSHFCTPVCQLVPFGGVGSALIRCEGTIQNNTIYGNDTEESGSAFWECTGQLVNNIVWGNSGRKRASLIVSSSTPTYSCIQDWTEGGEGNISIEPALIDPVNGDFRLSEFSPCIDAGAFLAEVDVDFEEEPRPFDASPEPRGDGSDYDIGADEYSFFPISLVDQNQDWRIDPLDLFNFQLGWMWEDVSGMKPDLNHDREIDAEDLLFLLKGWGESTGPSR